MDEQLYETAQPGEWWCGVCKRGHLLDSACPDSGQVVTGYLTWSPEEQADWDAMYDR